MYRINKTLIFTFLFVQIFFIGLQMLSAQKVMAGRIPDIVTSKQNHNQSQYAIIVQKDIQKLMVYSINGPIREIVRFNCSTGKSMGKKRVAGDSKTPEGLYFVTTEHLDKDLAPIYGTRAFPLDYPNALDREKGRNGSAIWIHGTNKKLISRDTNGCIALENQNIDSLKQYIRFNQTPVVIVNKWPDISGAIRKNMKQKISWFNSRWSQALVKGTYHDYLAFYHPEYLPDIKWWPQWRKKREWLASAGEMNEILIENVISLRLDGALAMVFDQFIKNREKKHFVGRKKLFLASKEGKLRIKAEEYQQTPFKPKKSIGAHPLILAAQSIGQSDISLPNFASIVDAWLKAWSEKDIKKYASFYATDFRSQGDADLAGWILYKKRLNRKYQYIRVSRKGLKVKPDNQEIFVSFTQNYASNVFKSTSIKTLRLKKEGNAWKIYRELTKRK